MKHPKCYITIGLAILMIFSGSCVPADTPPQLAFTPGPEFQITETEYANQAYSLVYPADWRVISGPGESAEQVILVSPDDDALIIVKTSPVETLPIIDGVTDTQNQYVELTEQSVHVYLVSDSALISTLEPIFEQVVSSIQRR